MPEGMVETDRNELTYITRINYENKNGKEFLLYARRITDGSGNTSSFDTEDAYTEEIYINNNPATLAIENNRTRLFFFINNYRCSISGTLSTDEIIKIAENIILQ